MSAEDLHWAYPSPDEERLATQSVLTELSDGDNIIKILEKIIKIVSGKCLTCIDHFKSGMVRSSRCSTACSYTAPALAITMRIVETHPPLITRLIEDDSITLDTAWDVLGEYVQYPKSNDVYQGIVNAIGLLWDVHDFSDRPDPIPFRRTGINYALDHKLPEWFVNPMELQEGVNIISFYSTSPDDFKILTIHHSFVYKLGSRCILIDSWNGTHSVENIKTARMETQGDSRVYYNKADKIIGETLSRPLSIREYPYDEFNEFLMTMNGNPSRRKITIMREVFGAFKYVAEDAYPYLNVCILSQGKLDEIIKEGFLAKEYLFGGKKTKTKRKRTRRNKSRRN